MKPFSPSSPAHMVQMCDVVQFDLCNCFVKNSVAKGLRSVMSRPTAHCGCFFVLEQTLTVVGGGCSVVDRQMKPDVLTDSAGTPQ